MNLFDAGNSFANPPLKHSRNTSLRREVEFLPNIDPRQLLGKHPLPMGLESKLFPSKRNSSLDVPHMSLKFNAHMDKTYESTAMKNHFFRNMTKKAVNYYAEKYRKGYFFDIFSKHSSRDLKSVKGFKIISPQTDFSISKNTTLKNRIDIEDDDVVKLVEDEEITWSDSERMEKKKMKKPKSLFGNDENAPKKPLRSIFHQEVLNYSSDDEDTDLYRYVTKIEKPSTTCLNQKEVLDSLKSSGECARSIITRVPDAKKILYSIDKTATTARCISIASFYGFYPDTSITFGKTTHKCHMHVLKNSGRYFAKRCNKRIYHLPKHDKIDVLYKKVYSFMLTGVMKTNVETFLNIFAIAQKFELTFLAEALWCQLEVLVKNYEQGALYLYLQARRLKIEHVQYVLVNKICTLFLKFVSALEFRLLSENDLCILLMSDRIGVNSESEVFFSLILWLEFDWYQRRKSVPNVVRCIRFQLMDADFLPRLVQINRNKVISYVLVVAHEIKLIRNCMVFWAVQKLSRTPEFLFPGSIRHYRGDKRSRVCVLNRDINYHHKKTCPRYVPITYSEFKYHMLRIHAEGMDVTVEYVRDPDTPCCLTLEDLNNMTMDNSFKIGYLNKSQGFPKRPTNANGK